MKGCYSPNDENMQSIPIQKQYLLRKSHGPSYSTSNFVGISDQLDSKLILNKHLINKQLTVCVTLKVYKYKTTKSMLDFVPKRILVKVRAWNGKYWPNLPL